MSPKTNLPLIESGLMTFIDRYTHDLYCDIHQMIHDPEYEHSFDTLNILEKKLNEFSQLLKVPYKSVTPLIFLVCDDHAYRFKTSSAINYGQHHILDIYINRDWSSESGHKHILMFKKDAYNYELLNKLWMEKYSELLPYEIEPQNIDSTLFFEGLDKLFVHNYSPFLDTNYESKLSDYSEASWRSQVYTDMN
tara:strand:- start:7807 stop:8385 length:579 start_codon:yes stop_codon:yes gene_type:complete